MKKTSEEVEKKVCQDYLTKKYSSRELSIKYSLSKNTVLRILKRNNIPIINKKLVNNDLILDYFKEINNEEKAYFLGFIFADGNISNNELFLEINEKDVEILQIFREKICSQAKISVRQRGKSFMARICIKNDEFVGYLKQYGIIENKTKKTTRLPIDLIPSNLFCHFLRGLIDGDGWVIKTKKNYYHIGFVTNYVSVANDFVQMLNYLIEDKWRNKIIIKNKKYAVIQIQKQSQVKQMAIALYMNSNIHLSRKFKMAQEIFDSKC